MAKVDIYIDAKVLYQMYEFAAYANSLFDGTEIAGWGHFNKDDGIYKLAPLPKQIVSGAEVDTFPNEILRDSKYDMSDMTVQWHSHVNMGCTPSQTDRQQILDSMELFPFLITIIVNCRNEYTAELHIKRSGQMVLPEHATYDVNLVPYYDNPDVKRLVKKQCRKPKVVKTKFVKTVETKKTNNVSTTEEENGEYGWNPNHGMGRYYGKNFYPDHNKYYVKDVNWNPLIHRYDRAQMGEILVYPESVLSPSENELNLFRRQEGDNDFYNDYDIKQIIRKADALEKARPMDFAKVTADKVHFIQHTKSSIYCEIHVKEREVYVGGDIGEWNDFLKATGALEADFWYSPADCISCSGTGLSSKNKMCKACKGTGERKQTA